LKQKRVLTEEWKRKIALANTGKKHSEETKRKIGKAQEGSKGNNWKGGIIMDKEGYILERRKDHHFKNSAGYVRQHRLVIEEKLQCCLLQWTIVHHLDGDKTNNDFTNLILTNQSKHCGGHNKFRKRVDL